MSFRLATLVLCFAASWALARRAAAETPAAPHTSLRVLTYNVLADAVHVEQRAPELLRLMREADADILALQEVAPWFARLLLEEPRVRAYQRATRAGKTVLAHEHIVLSRFPVLADETIALPGAQRRVVHLVTLEIDGVPTAVATTHLESLLEDGPMRAQQLGVIFGQLEPHGEALFAGDFNFGDGEMPETAALPSTFLDAWRAVHRDAPGYTWDVKRSRMARDASFPGEGSRRLDRILIRSSRWRPVSATILGDAPAPGPRRHVFPSDHFGVLASFARVDSEASSAAP